MQSNWKNFIPALLVPIIAGVFLYHYQKNDGFSFSNGNDSNESFKLDRKLKKAIQKGLVAYYPFNGDANDESGNKNHGDVNGPILAEDINGKKNSAYQFDGSDDYIKVEHSSTLHFKDDFTLSAWLKYPSQVGGRNDYGAIFVKGVHSSTMEWNYVFC